MFDPKILLIYLLLDRKSLFYLFCLEKLRALFQFPLFLSKPRWVIGYEDDGSFVSNLNRKNILFLLPFVAIDACNIYLFNFSKQFEI